MPAPVCHVDGLRSWSRCLRVLSAEWQDEAFIEETVVKDAVNSIAEAGVVSWIVV